jgi:hypothetical protein
MKKSKKHNHSAPRVICPLRRRGQAMILTAIALGGSILGATTIAGLLVVYQIRQASDFSASGRAIYAADAGIEWALYKFFVGSAAPPAFVNSAGVRVTCLDAGNPVDCGNIETDVIRALGKFGNVNRALELTVNF